MDYEDATPKHALPELIDDVLESEVVRRKGKRRDGVGMYGMVNAGWEGMGWDAVRFALSPVHGRRLPVCS